MGTILLRIRSWLILLLILLLSLFPVSDGPFVLLKILAVLLPGLWVYAIGNKAFGLLEPGSRPGKQAYIWFKAFGAAYFFLPFIDYLLLGIWNPETG